MAANNQDFVDLALSLSSPALPYAFQLQLFQMEGIWTGLFIL